MVAKKEELPEDYRKVKPGRYLARQVKTAEGSWKDEIKKYPDGRTPHQVVYPYTKRRGSLAHFREMKISEVDTHHKILNGVKAKPLYDVLERKLKEAEDRERLREELVRKRKIELDKKNKLAQIALEKK